MPAHRQPKRNKRYEEDDRISEERIGHNPVLTAAETGHRGEEISACTIPNDQSEADLFCFIVLF